MAEDIFDGPVGRQPKYVMTMPERVEQQTPRGLMVPFQVGEGAGDVLLAEQLANARLACNQIFDKWLTISDPFAHRRVETGLPRIRLGGGH